MAEHVLRGLAASPGMAAGVAVVLDAPTAGEQNLPAAERPGASLRAADALRAAARELDELARTLAADGLSDDAQIVEAGALLARDPALEGAVERAVL